MKLRSGKRVNGANIPNQKRRKTTNRKKQEKPAGALAIPQLNEDILGKILKFVVEGKQNQIYDVIDKEKQWPRNNQFKDVGTFKKDLNADVFAKGKTGLHLVKWPELLKTNGQRLVHHAEVKMMGNLHYYHWAEKFQVAQPRHPTKFWDAVKHIGHLKMSVVDDKSIDTCYVSTCPVEVTMEDLAMYLEEEDGFKWLKRRHSRCLHKCVDDPTATDMDLFENRRLYHAMYLYREGDSDTEEYYAYLNAEPDSDEYDGYEGCERHWDDSDEESDGDEESDDEESEESD